jgi:membrane protein YdbS with pleckstrin-like domain
VTSVDRDQPRQAEPTFPGTLLLLAAWTPLTLMGTILCLLRLVGVVTWSWWWVTAPFWFPSALIALAAAVAIPVLLITERHRDERTRY